MKENQEKNETSQASDFEFLQEKIKERPINKKKLLQRTVITASLALLFGLIACFTFLLLEPVLNNWLYPEEAPEIITFPQEKNEMLPEDMLTEEEEQMQTAAAEKETSVSVQKPQENLYEREEVFAQEDMYQKVRESYKKAIISMVTVTSVNSDVDWFNNPYEREGKIAGVIIANNNRELLILTRCAPLKEAESIRVTFYNGESAEGKIKKYDVNTDLAVIAIELKYLQPFTLEVIAVAKLGSSADTNLRGTPVIAIGNVIGYQDSICYGMITSTENALTMADNEYQLITTDIYGSQNPSGILINMEGNVLGILDNSYNNDDTKNLISAVGITELKGMIAKLSNGVDVPYAGIHAQNISGEKRKELGIPQGAYILDIDMDSPAMEKGIQKGDIIIRVGEKEIRSVADYMNAIRGYAAGRDVMISVLRYTQEAYEEMEFVVGLAVQE